MRDGVQTSQETGGKLGFRNGHPGPGSMLQGAEPRAGQGLVSGRAWGAPSPAGCSPGSPRQIEQSLRPGSTLPLFYVFPLSEALASGALLILQGRSLPGNRKLLLGSELFKCKPAHAEPTGPLLYWALTRPQARHLLP